MGASTEGGLTFMRASRSSCCVRMIGRLHRLGQPKQRACEALATLRGKPLPGLEELLESARTVLTFGADSPCS